MGHVRASDDELMHGYRDYYQAARVAFKTTLERIDATDEEQFKSALKFAIEHFGMKAGALADRLKHGKGTISKWINSDAMPSLATREVAISWMKDQITSQIEDNFIDGQKEFTVNEKELHNHLELA